MPFYILLILGALSAFGPLAIDMYLPAFPAIGEALNADAEHVQMSLSVYLPVRWYATCVHRLMLPRPFRS